MMTGISPSFAGAVCLGVSVTLEHLVEKVHEVKCDQFFHIVVVPCMYDNSGLYVQVLKFAPSFETTDTVDAKEV